MANPKPTLEEEREALLREQRELRAAVKQDFPLMTWNVATERAHRLAEIHARLLGIDRLLDK